jgi:hypothetical protein
MKPWSKLVLALLVAGALLLVPLAPATQAANPSPRVLPPTSHAFGKTYAEWSVAWWQWALSQPAPSNPILDTSGAACANGQSGPVWFLAGTSGFPVTRTCAVPSGKAILFPIINVENDFPCPDPTFKPAPGQSLEDFLTIGARAVIDPHTDLQASVDGVALQDLLDYRATSRLFTFTGDPSLTATFDPCITGSPQQAVSDGYWIMLAPLPRGSHVVKFGSPSYGQDNTYTLTVAAR